MPSNLKILIENRRKEFEPEEMIW